MGSETTTAFEKQYAEILREAGPVSDDMLFQLTGLALLRQEPTSCSRNLAVLLGFYRESLQRGVASSKFLGPSLAVAKNLSEGGERVQTISPREFAEQLRKMGKLTVVKGEGLSLSSQMEDEIVRSVVENILERYEGVRTDDVRILEIHVGTLDDDGPRSPWGEMYSVAARLSFRGDAYASSYTPPFQDG